MKVMLAGALFLATCVPARPALAQAAPSVVRFQVNDIELAGATLLPESEWRPLARPLLGTLASFAELEAVRAAIEARYHALGWRLAAVRIPAQSTTGGVIRMQAVEPKLASVTLGKPSQLGEAHWRAALPALREGFGPNLDELDRQLTLNNENPSKRVQVAFSQAGAPGELSAVIQQEEASASTGSAFLDNTGNAQTGRLRYGLAWRHNNVFGLDHQLNAQVISAPHDPDNPDRLRILPSHKVKIFGLGYRVPLYRQGAALDLTLGHSSVDSGVLADLFTVTGKGSTAALRYTQMLGRAGGWEPRLSVGADWRHFDSQLLFGGTNLAVPLELHPVSLGFAATRAPTPQHALGYGVHAGLVANIPGGDNGSQASFTASRVGATAHYKLLRAGGSMAAPIGAWQLSVGLDAQWTGDLLVSGEQFSAGGAGSVRGFSDRGVSGDKGLRLQVEALSPNWLDPQTQPQASVRGVVFLEAAASQRNQPAPLEMASTSIAAMGVGLRGMWGPSAWRLDVARAIHQRTGASPVWGAVHFSVSVGF